MSKVIIFGNKDTAELAHYYLQKDSEHEVVAFSLNEKYIEKTTFNGLPVLPFEDIEKNLSPSDFKFFAPMTGKNMNKDREKIYNECKEKGYDLISYVSSKATVLDNFIGENCFILEDNTLQPFTTVGNNVVMWSGNHIGHHGKIGDHVFFTSHVVMSGHCNIESHCWFGVNSTIRDYAHFKEGTLLAMGSSFTKKETEPWSVYMGVPAKKLKGKKSTDVI
tara:strand:- start:33 stop:692 length:660 start_codon:yes stop_codon:yes gene_type:complete